MRTCIIEDCDKRHHGRGYCRTHHSRWYTRGTTDQPIVIRRPAVARRCELPGCERTHQAKGMCRRCYQKHNYRPRHANRIKGGVEHNTVCMKRGGCDQPPEGGGVYCLPHFWSEIVMPGKRRRGEL